MTVWKSFHLSALRLNSQDHSYIGLIIILIFKWENWGCLTWKSGGMWGLLLCRWMRCPRPTGLNVTHGLFLLFCSLTTAWVELQDISVSDPQTLDQLGLAALGISFFSVTCLHLNSPSPLTFSEKSVLSRRKIGLYCWHNLNLLSTDKPQLVKLKSKIK